MARRDADFMRSSGAAVYRLLRDVAGPDGLVALDIAAALTISTDSPWDRTRVFMAMNWLRAVGVDVVCAKAGDKTSPSRWALRSLLPESWDAMIGIAASPHP